MVKMRAFDSIAKKLAIPVIVLFEIGWIIYTAGLGVQLHLVRTDQVLYPRDPLHVSRGLVGPVKALKSQYLFPDYFTLVGGQFVALFFLLHAALPSSIASYVVGVLSTLLNVIYFVSVGYLLNINPPELDRTTPYWLDPYSPSYGNAHVSQLQLHALRCMFTGTIFMAISWGLIQLLGLFYESRCKPNLTEPLQRRNLWYVIREFGQLCVRGPSRSRFELKATPGEMSRLCALPLLILSAIGWCVCVTGLHMFNKNSRCTPYVYGDWATISIPPLLYLAALLHAGCSGDASIMSGVFAAILNTFFVLNVGYTVVKTSFEKEIRIEYSRWFGPDSRIDPEDVHIDDLILGGSAACLFFWTVIHIFWHFFSLNGSSDHATVQLNSSANVPGPQEITQTQQTECSSNPMITDSAI